MLINCWLVSSPLLFAQKFVLLSSLRLEVALQLVLLHLKGLREQLIRQGNRLLSLIRKYLRC
jgi:hypothetical protein